jgi:hypothetical protein
MNSHLIIRICSHTFSDGRHCHAPAVRGRACCRHHLGARTRLHNMARARRLACIPRLCVPTTWLDLALNRAEVLRVVTAGGVDFATARMLLWAMDLTAAVLPAEPTTRLRRPRNPNVYYYVPINPLFSQSCTKNPSQVPENTRRRGEGAPLNNAYSACARFRANHKKTGMPDRISPQPHIEFLTFSWNV